MRPTAILIPAITALAFSTTTHAQCDGTWLPWPTTGQSVLNSTGVATIAWDSDGPGHLSEWTIVGGDFTQVGGVPGTQHIAAWDGEQWHDLAGGMNGRPDGFARYQDKLVAVGAFTTSGKVITPRVAVWDGQSWAAMGQLNQSMLCATVFKGELIAAGYGSPSQRGIVRWNGTSWDVLGTGLTSNSSEFIIALTEYNGDLIAAGTFVSTGTQTVNHIARWDGSNWHALGNGVASGASGAVRDLAVYDNHLVVGGAFSSADGHPGTQYIAQWDGVQWSSFPGSFNNIVNCFTIFNSKLVVGGYFTRINNVLFNRIAVWNSSTWSALGAGLSGSAIPGPFRMGVSNGDLSVVGAFFTSGSVSGWAAARWTETSIPTIAAHPAPLTINPTDTATFTITPTYGYASLSTLSYQWHRNNQRLDDDARITGATTPTLTITPTQPTDAGDYTCAISNTCGTITTNPATLTINTPPPPCPGDANHDNTINGADLSVLLSNFGNTVPPGTAADFNNNGIINGADLSVLLSNFGASC